MASSSYAPNTVTIGQIDLDMGILSLFYSACWFMLPAGMANMAPVLGAKLFPSWDYPLDAYKELRGRRILGDHKTVRGLVIAIIVGIGVFLWQQHIHVSSEGLWLDYARAPWYLGGLFGFGAITGDAVKSLIKRQLNIPPGKPWFPFDQSDWIIGTLLAILPFVQLTLLQIAALFIFGIALHLLSKILGKIVRLNKTYI